MQREFGTAVALSDRFLAVADPGNDVAAINAGAVQIFDARTGRFLRNLVAGDAAPNQRLFTSVAISGPLLVAGATFGDGVAAQSGAAYVFDLRTGRQIAKLIDPAGQVGARFGDSVAIHGDHVVVGSPVKDGFTGTAFLFHARSGTLLAEWQITPGLRAAGDRFGSSVAICGGWGLVGASGASGGDAFSGNAYLFEVRDAGGAVVTEFGDLPAADSIVNDLFGASVALDGRYAVIGAPGRDEFGPDLGAAYVFDVTTGNQIKKLVPDGVTGVDLLGRRVAISGSLALVATDKNLVLLYDLSGDETDLSQVVNLRPLEVGQFGFAYGESVALCGNRALIGARAFDGGINMGAAYLVQDLAGGLPLDFVARRRGLADGVVDATFGNFREVFINPNGKVSLLANLAGPGTAGGKTQGIWAENPSFVAPPLLVKNALSGEDLTTIFLPGVSVAGIQRTTFNRAATGFALGTLRGAGVTMRNNGMIASFGAGITVVALRTGPTLAFGGAGAEEILRFNDLAQARLFDLAAVAYQMRVGTGAVFWGNDSGILSVDPIGSVFGTDTGEGRVIPPGGLDTFGQFFGRVAQSRGTTARGFGAFVVSGLDGSSRQQLFVDDIFSDPVGGPTQGDAAPGAVGGAGPATVRGFLGETVDGGDFLVWRAALTGPGLPGPLREGLWSESGGGAKVVQRGEILDPANEPGVKAARILGFWTSESSDVFLLLKLAGPGITAANDCAFYRWDATAGTLARLLREGDAVGGGDGARVGVIQRVTVGDGGRYLLACSLTGVSAATNQALLAGDGLQTEPALRLPYVALRKGVKYSSGLNAITAIRGLTFQPNTDRTGAGGKGLGQAVNAAGEAALTITFDNGAVEVMKGGL